MGDIRELLKEKYHLSNYQIAQITFLLKTIASEASKILIMGILFHEKLPDYIFALFIMIFLRSAMGGLHFYTYIGCLITSILYLWSAIYVFPLLAITLHVQLVLLLICILICNKIGPITSKYRPDSCKQYFESCKKFISIFIFIYSLILYIIPDNHFLYIGFWVIILHSIQLIIAKIRKKGELIK